MSSGNLPEEGGRRELLTELLNRMGQGDRLAGNEAAPLVYDELHHIAARAMRAERPGHALQATALVHEAYLRLIDDQKFRVESRAHFFALASVQMRRVLVDHARAVKAGKRGGGIVHESLDRVQIAVENGKADLLMLDESLRELELVDPRAAKVVELKYFGGFTDKEAAEAMAISPKTVRKDWEYARSWLISRMERSH